MSGGVWVKPDWKDAKGNKNLLSEVSLEYFDSNEKLIGLVQPYGSIWVASLVEVKTSLEYKVYGYYRTLEAAKIAIEKTVSS